MNPLDILMILIFVYCLIMGCFRGIVRELISIVGVLAGLWVACAYHSGLAKYLSEWISDPSYLSILSFLILFSAVFLVISVVGILIKYLLKIATIGWRDRVSGGAGAAFKGMLIASSLLLAFVTFLPKNSPIIRDSLLSPRVSVISEKMAHVFSKDIGNRFDAKIKPLRDTWKAKSEAKSK